MDSSATEGSKTNTAANTAQHATGRESGSDRVRKEPSPFGSNPPVHSFDIFDTLLTRRVADPTTVFLILGRAPAHRRLTGMEASAFRKLRVRAEAASRLHAANGEIELDAIYRTSAHFALAFEGKTAELTQAELELERRLIVPVPGAARKLEEIRATGARIRFVSDMYLPPEFLTELLQEHGFCKEGDELLLSAREGCSKSGGGRLFLRLMEREAVAPGAVTHYGNDAHADVTQPGRLGINVRPFPEGNPNRYERLLESYSDETGGATGLLAGASRLARLEIAPGAARDRAIVDVAAGVAAPALVAYLWWVLTNARSRKLERLYFLSRDGELLHRVALELAPKVGYSGELRYLYGGRKAWFTARSQTVDDFLLDYAFECPDFLTPAMVARRLGITGETLAPALKVAGLPESEIGRRLTREERQELRVACREGETARAVLENAGEARRLTVDYLRQEGLLGNTANGLVDIGWTGKTVRCLSEILQSSGAASPTVFFFGLFHCKLPEDHSVPEAFLFDEHRGLGFCDPAFSPVHYTRILENFCAGSHGSVTGYVREDDKIRPRLKSDTNPEPWQWGMPLVRKTIEAFLQHLDLSVLPSSSVPPLQPATEALIREFYERPTRAEAEAWGSFPVETDAAADYRNAWTRPFSFRDVKEMFIRGHLIISSTHWHAGSAAISSRPVLESLRLARKFRSLGNQVKRTFLRR